MGSTGLRAEDRNSMWPFVLRTSAVLLLGNNQHLMPRTSEAPIGSASRLHGAP